MTALYVWVHVCLYVHMWVCMPMHLCVYRFVCVSRANNFNSCSQAVITMHGFRSVSLANSSHHTTLKQPDITAQRANADLLDHSATTHKPLCFSWRFKLWLSDEKPNQDKWSVEVDRCKSFPWKAGLQSAYKRWQMFLATCLIDDVIIKSATWADTVVLLLHKYTHTHSYGNSQGKVAYAHGVTGGNVKQPWWRHDDDQRVLPSNSIHADLFH